MKLQEENTELREAIELLQVVPLIGEEHENKWAGIGQRRSSPDGMEQGEDTREPYVEKTNLNCFYK